MDAGLRQCGETGRFFSAFTERSFSDSKLFNGYRGG